MVSAMNNILSIHYPPICNGHGPPHQVGQGTSILHIGADASGQCQPACGSLAVAKVHLSACPDSQSSGFQTLTLSLSYTTKDTDINPFSVHDHQGCKDEPNLCPRTAGILTLTLSLETNRDVRTAPFTTLVMLA